MKKISINDVAKYFLYLSLPGTPRGITHLKLQKLTFYSQALSYAFNQRELFDEDFEAWVHGPVSPDLYYAYKEYGSKEINKLDEKPKIPKKDELIIKTVWIMYGSKDGKFLENKTHNEKPWQEARKGLNYYNHSNNVIKKSSIRDYYSLKFVVKNSLTS